MDLVWPFVKRQHCWSHKLLNVANYLKKKHRDSCIKEARAIYNATNTREAERAYSKWEKKWASIYPKAVEVRTTNVIERAFRDVRRRVRPMSCSSHDKSIQRIVYSVLSHQNEQWGKKLLKEFTQND